MKNFLVGCALLLFTAFAFSSNGILNVKVPLPVEPDPAVPDAWNPCGEWVKFDEGQTVHVIFRQSPKKNGGFQIVNHANAQVTAVGQQSGHEYMGNLVAGAPAIGTPPGWSSVVNITPDFRGAGMFKLRLQLVSPSNPEVGVGVIDNMVHLIWDGDPDNPTYVFEKLKSTCHGALLSEN